jgi:hypothetical protein
MGSTDFGSARVLLFSSEPDFFLLVYFTHIQPEGSTGVHNGVWVKVIAQYADPSIAGLGMFSSSQGAVCLPIP